MVGKVSKDEPVWRPQAEGAQQSAMARFARRYKPSAKGVDYARLHRWSITEVEPFWSAVGEFCGLEFETPAAQVFSANASVRGGAWFPGGRLSFAGHLLRGDADAIAIIFRDERGRREQVTRGELRSRVANVAAALEQSGVRSGDRVATVLPNCIASVVIMLATAELGALFSSCSPDFGNRAVLERLGQIKPKLLFACDGYSYAGKKIACLERVREICAALPSLEATVIVPFLDDQPDLRQVEGALSYENFCVAGSRFEARAWPFEQPLFVMYSSGTTGQPKCMVHGAGGTLLQHMKEHVLHTDIQPGERVFYFTTCGWMMWNWLVTSLASGATIVLYDGSPTFPDIGVLWRLAEAERVAVFGTSPRYLQALKQAAYPVAAQFKIPALRTLLSTGAPLPAESFDFVRDAIGADLQVCSISGGTDLISCFVSGNPLLPVFRGEIQCAALGMAVDVFDKEGRSLRGAPGELVCTEKFPSMPLRFWNDARDQQYRSAYFERFPHIWAQGDRAMWTEHAGLIISGRSDATLNPGGVRIGTAEVCGPAVGVPEVADAIAVARRTNDDEQIILFVVLADNCVFDRALQNTIAQAIRTASSPRHVPAEIVAVPDIPRTISGKSVELAVRALVNGEDPPDTGSLANPEALKYFRRAP